MDRLTRTVREQLALGRLLALGDPDEALWITESAVRELLRRAARAVPGVRLGHVAVRLADMPYEAVETAKTAEPAEPADSAEPIGPTAAAGPSAERFADLAYEEPPVPASAAVPVRATQVRAAPAGALPHAPLSVTADFEAAVDEPLPQSADRLRAALWAAVRDGLDAEVAAVDLRITGLLDAGPGQPGGPEPGEPPAEPGDTGPAIVQGTSEAVEAAVRAVPGVARLTHRLSGFGAGVRVRDTAPGDGSPARTVQVQIAVAAGRTPVGVARAAAAAARTAAARDAPGPVSAALVVTDA